MSASVTTTTISNPLLPPEVWEIVFLSIPSLNDLLRTSNVCRTFYRLIRNERFLKKYFRGDISTLTKDLGVLCNFTFNTAVDSGDFLYNNKDSDTNQPRPRVNGAHPRIDVVDSRPCLTFQSGAPTVNFVVTPSGELTLLFNFDDEQRRRQQRDNILIGQQLQLNTWYHSVTIFSLTQSIIKFYLNGNKTNEEPMVDQLDSDGTVLVRSQSEDGCLADIALWSRELLPMEIQSMFNQNTSVDKIDMVTYILNQNSIL